MFQSHWQSSPGTNTTVWSTGFSFMVKARVDGRAHGVKTCASPNKYYSVAYFECFTKLPKHMCQCWIESKCFSVAYFKHVTEFDMLLRWASAKGGAHTRCVNAWISDASIKRPWDPPSAEAKYYSVSNAVMHFRYAMEKYLISIRDSHIWWCSAWL